MHYALTLLAQKVKLVIETDDKETWQGLKSTLQRRNKRKRRIRGRK
jgi:hypothetical protein